MEVDDDMDNDVEVNIDDDMDDDVNRGDINGDFWLGRLMMWIMRLKMRWMMKSMLT